MFQMTFILIAYFDWLLGPQKGQIFGKKKSLEIFSETVCFMKLILCIHVPGISLYKKKFFFCSSQIRTLVAMATFSFHRLIMGKVKICYFCSLIGDIRILFLEKCLLSNALRFR